MSTFWQTVIPPALAALIAGRIAWTRTSRLLRTINTNFDLIDRLPAEHPKRAMLEDRNGELLDLLVRRQERRFGLFTQAGFSVGALTGVAAVALAFAGYGALMALGFVPSTSEPPDSRDGWAGMVFFLLVAGGCMVAVLWSARRQLKEHPPTAE